MWELDFIRAVQETLGLSSAFSRLMQSFTMIGDAGLLWLFLGGIFMFFKKTRKTGITLFICFVFTVLLNEYIVKNIVGRGRPINLDNEIGYAIKEFSKPFMLPSGTLPLNLFCMPSPTSHSFMSGHTTMAFSSAFVIFFNHKKWGWTALVAAFLVGFSRIFFGVHYVTDVLSGAIFSSVFALFVCLLSRIGLANLETWWAKRKQKKAISDS